MHKRWGWMLTLFKGKQFKVKLLYFKKDGEISMQRHKYREELWLYIFGKGKMHHGTPGLYENVKKGMKSIIPPNVWHLYRAEEPTLVLEIQYGDKCSDRDIKRA